MLFRSRTCSGACEVDPRHLPGRRGDGFRFVAPIDQKACKIALKVNDCRTRWSRVLIPENGLLSGGIFGGTNGKVTLLRSTGIKRLPGLFDSWWVRCRATRYLPDRQSTLPNSSH